MCQCSAVDGGPQDWHLVHLRALAVPGPGLIMTEATGVTPDGRISPRCTGIWNDKQARAWTRINRFVDVPLGDPTRARRAQRIRRGVRGQLEDGADRRRRLADEGPLGDRGCRRRSARHLKRRTRPAPGYPDRTRLSGSVRRAVREVARVRPRISPRRRSGRCRAGGRNSPTRSPESALTRRSTRGSMSR